MNINPFDLLKNAKQLQEQMGQMQEKLGAILAKGSAGGGMVEIELNGKLEVVSVMISEEIMAEGDREMLQDLVAAAFNSAKEKVHEVITQEMGAMTGMPIPGFNP